MGVGGCKRQILELGLAVRFIQPAPKESCLTAHTSHAFLHSSLMHHLLPFLHHHQALVKDSASGGNHNLQDQSVQVDFHKSNQILMPFYKKRLWYVKDGRRAV